MENNKKVKETVLKIDIAAAVKNDVQCAISLMNMVVHDEEIMKLIVTKMEKAREAYLQEEMFQKDNSANGGAS